MRPRSRPGMMLSGRLPLLPGAGVLKGSDALLQCGDAVFRHCASRPPGSHICQAIQQGLKTTTASAPGWPVDGK